MLLQSYITSLMTFDVQRYTLFKNNKACLSFFYHYFNGFITKRYT